MKKIVITAYLFASLSLFTTFAQTSYLMSLSNASHSNENTFEFDVYLKSTGANFVLTSYQCAFTFNVGNTNGGSLSFSYIANTSELSNAPLVGVGINNSDGLSELTFASTAGVDTIKSIIKRVGRFKIQNSAAFTNPSSNITWNFAGAINTIITSTTFINITNPAFHTNLTTSADTTAPCVLGVTTISNTKIELNFSEALNQTSAANISNYVINNGISVSSALISSDQMRVTLTTSQHSVEQLYTVVVNNVKDSSGNLISPTANSAQYSFGENSRLNIKVFLQGPYSNNSMNTYLRTFNLIPLTQPYNKPPWNYSGNEQVTAISSGIVDWVLIELRSGTSGSTMVMRRAAFLKSNGSVVDLDGTNTVVLNGVAAGDYYVIIRHRNHLAIMSAIKITLSSSSSLYDFTNAITKAYGSSAMANLGNGFYGMRSGDADVNGKVNNVDINNFWKVENGSVGYKTSDFDLNGGVNIADKNSKWKINSGKSTRVPN